jgi:hypothetical protein
VKARDGDGESELGRLGSTRLAGGIEIVRASPKSSTTPPDPHDTPLLSLFLRIPKMATQISAGGSGNAAFKVRGAAAALGDGS